MELVTTAHRDRPTMDMALTGALLDAVAHGSAPETIRVFRPGPTLAFGRLDRTRTGFANACRVALTHGRTPVLRWGGGHAAAYDPNCVLIEIIRRHEHSIGDLEGRFTDMVALVQQALARLGVQLELGELRGEYCPGRFSLHLPAGPKVAGVAQRVLARASLTTAVVVAGSGDALRDTLTDVYEALDLPIDIRAAGALSDRLPEVSAESVADAIHAEAVEKYRAVPAHVTAETIRHANGLPLLSAVTPLCVSVEPT